MNGDASFAGIEELSSSLEVRLRGERKTKSRTRQICFHPVHESRDRSYLAEQLIYWDVNLLGIGDVVPGTVDEGRVA